MKKESAIRHRMNRVINRLQDDNVSINNLEQMADIACMSKYHFTRVFKSYSGETPYQYLHRTRLEFVARCLCYQPSKSITQVAFESGFDNQSLSSAFKKNFHRAPSVFIDDTRTVSSGYDKPGPFLDLLETQSIMVAFSYVSHF